MRGVLIIYKSENGIDGWEPVKTIDVPEWVKDPDVMGRIVDGEACMDNTQSSGTDWFIARRLINGEEAAVLEREQIEFTVN